MKYIEIDILESDYKSFQDVDKICIEHYQNKYVKINRLDTKSSYDFSFESEKQSLAFYRRVQYFLINEDKVLHISIKDCKNGRLHNPIIGK